MASRLSCMGCATEADNSLRLLTLSTGMRKIPYPAHQEMSETKRELSERVASLVEQFATLDANHKDINALLAKLNTELKARAS